MWLAHASPKLRIEALLEPLSIEDESETLDSDAQPTVEDILYCCSSLIRRTGSRLELAHFTVQEYLQTINADGGYLGSFRLSKDPKHVLARTCLRYLCFPIFDRPLNFETDEMLHFESSHPFHEHASTAWSDYVKDYQDHPDIEHLYQILFAPEKTRNFKLFLRQVLSKEGIPCDMEMEINHEDAFRTLHAAALLAQTPICQWLLQEGCDIDHESFLESPLQIAYDGVLGDGVVNPSDYAATALFLIKSGVSQHHLPESFLGFISEVYSHGCTASDDDFLASQAFKVTKQPRKPLSSSLPGVFAPMSYEGLHERLYELVLLDQVDQLEQLAADKRFHASIIINGQSVLQIAAQSGAARTLDRLLTSDPAGMTSETV